MNNPGPQTNSVWMQNGARSAGIVIAGCCSIFLLFIGFGLLLTGTITYCTSSSFDDFAGKGTNPPRTAGICLLVIGGISVVSGAVMLIIAKKQLNKIRSENRFPANETTVLPPAPVIAGSPYHSGYQSQAPGSYPPGDAGSTYQTSYTSQYTGGYPPQNYQQSPPQAPGPYSPGQNSQYNPQDHFPDKEMEMRPPPYSP